MLLVGMLPRTQHKTRQESKTKRMINIIPLPLFPQFCQLPRIATQTVYPSTGDSIFINLKEGIYQDCNI